MAITKKKIKYSPINEQIVLGTMIRNGILRKRLVRELSSKNFSGERHKALFLALRELTERNLDPTPGTIKSLIPKDVDYGGNAYIDKLEGLSSESNIEYHITKTKWDVTRNQIILKKIPEFESILKDPRLEPEDSLEILSQLENKIRNVITNDKSIKSGKDVSAQYKANECAIEAGLSSRSSGYLALDNILNDCFSPGKFSVISAAPSIGKTTLSINMLARQAKNYKVGYMPWEGGINSVIDTLCASQTNIPTWKIIKYRDRLTQEEIKRKDRFIEEYIDTKRISFLERPPKELFRGKQSYLANDILLDWFEEKLEEWDVDIFYWDLFELGMRDTRPDAISWALSRFQDMMCSSSKHGVLLHQITFKEVEKNKSQRPTRATLKGSGAYIERPDNVFTLYREGFYDRGMTDDVLEVTCWKQRKGKAPFRVLFKWEGEYARVSGGREVDMFDNSFIDLEV